jgi:hypothetical protein
VQSGIASTSYSSPVLLTSQVPETDELLFANAITVSPTDILSREMQQASTPGRQESLYPSSSSHVEKTNSLFCLVGGHSDVTELPPPPRFMGSSPATTHSASSLQSDRSSMSVVTTTASTSLPLNSSRTATPAAGRLPSYSESLHGEEADSQKFDQPPAYRSGQVLELNANTPLRFRQVQELRDEMLKTDGVIVVLTSAECSSSLAIVDAFNTVW